LNRSNHSRRPLIVGIGGTTRAASSTERALAFALRGAEAAGAHTRLFGGAFLQSLPHYAPEHDERTAEQLELVEAVRHADALIIATPGYHGGVSGLVKNALDTLEELRADERPYLDGRAVGCIVTAYGWQAAGSVLTSLRSIVHALRGWPTPFGAGINTLETRFGDAHASRFFDSLRHAITVPRRPRRARAPDRVSPRAKLRFIGLRAIRAPHNRRLFPSRIV